MRHAAAILDTDTLHYTPAEAGRREAQKIKAMQRCDSFPAAPCPACGHPLLPRMTRRGPRFLCGCRN